jgi:hypothetical protein
MLVEGLTKGAIKIPSSSETTYAQAGNVTFCVVTTIRPRTKLRISTTMYHHHGASL